MKRFLTSPAIAFAVLTGSFSTALADSTAASTPQAPSVRLFIRGDFSDVGLFRTPNAQDRFESVGAQATATYNQLTEQAGVSLDGVAAVAIRYFGDDSDLLALVFGPYVQGDGTYLFKTPTLPDKPSDTITAGGFAQLGFNSALMDGQDYFRVRVGYSYGSSGTSSTTAVGEWIPYYSAMRPGAAFGGPLFYTLAPEMMLQYDHLDGGPNKYLLFSKHVDSLRIGPELVARFWFNTDLSDLPDGALRTFLDRSALSLTYHVSADTYSGRGYYWTAETLSYSLDEAGHFGLSASFGYGNSEATGNMTNQIKLGLSIKL